MKYNKKDAYENKCKNLTISKFILYENRKTTNVVNNNDVCHIKPIFCFSNTIFVVLIGAVTNLAKKRGSMIFAYWPATLHSSPNTNAKRSSTIKYRTTKVGTAINISPLNVELNVCTAQPVLLRSSLAFSKNTWPTAFPTSEEGIPIAVLPIE